MVNRLKLNEKTLREAEPKPGVSYQVFDTEVIGFAARVQASGTRTFTIDYRHAGRQRRMTNGALAGVECHGRARTRKGTAPRHRRGTGSSGDARRVARDPARHRHD